MKKYKFTATIEKGDRGGAYVLFPYDVGREFGGKGRVPVQATFNGVCYAGSLVKYGSLQHVLGILKSIRAQIGADVGDKVQVEVWKDDTTRTVDVPAELQDALNAAGVLSFFESLSYSQRREYYRRISEAKTEQTRLKRIAETTEMLKRKAVRPPNADK